MKIRIVLFILGLTGIVVSCIPSLDSDFEKVTGCGSGKRIFHWDNPTGIICFSIFKGKAGTVKGKLNQGTSAVPSSGLRS